MDGLYDVINTGVTGNSIDRNGYVFAAYDTANVFDAIVVRNPINCECWTPKYKFSSKTLEDHISLINEYKLEKAIIIAEDISFLGKCPTLKYIEVIPSDTADAYFDYTGLYSIPNIIALRCRTKYGGSLEPHSTTVDYSKICGLRQVYISGKGHLHYEHLDSLETIKLDNEKSQRDLRYLYRCKDLKSIDLSNCKMSSLSGIEKFSDLQQVSVSFDRSLSDISDLKSISKTLRALHIENCPKINDFSCLPCLTELEHLALYGNNVLPNLSFLYCMKKLKTFTFSMEVFDGNLEYCLDVPYVYCEKNRKQYNYKNKDLPKKLLRGFKLK